MPSHCTCSSPIARSGRNFGKTGSLKQTPVVASENAHNARCDAGEPASENTKHPPRGRAPIELDGRYAAVLHQYLAWLAHTDPGADPLASPEARDWAVRDYRTNLQTVQKRRPATVNNALAAVDDLYIRLGHGPANAKRAEIPPAAPRALDPRAQIRYLRAVHASPSPRDRALALVPFYA